MPPEVEAWSLNHWTAREVLSSFSFFFFLKIYCLFIYFRLRWVLVVACGIFVEAHGIFRCGVRALCCGVRASL